MTFLRHSLSNADSSHYFAAASACSRYVAAVDVTFLQQSLLAIAGSTFDAVDMISLRHSLSIADSHYFAAAIACSDYVATVAMTSLQHSLSAIAGGNFAAVDLTSLH